MEALCGRFAKVDIRVNAYDRGTGSASRALLCSKMGWWLISELCPPIQNGYQLIWDNFRQIPIPMTLPDSLSKLATQAEQATAEGDNEKLQIVKNNINKEVYRLYKLTYDDILIIDPELSFTREVYEEMEEEI